MLARVTYKWLVGIRAFTLIFGCTIFPKKMSWTIPTYLQTYVHSSMLATSAPKGEIGEIDSHMFTLRTIRMKLRNRAIQLGIGRTSTHSSPINHKPVGWLVPLELKLREPTNHSRLGIHTYACIL